MTPEEKAKDLVQSFGYLDDFHKVKAAEKSILKALKEAISKEREACAKVADNLADRLIKKYDPRQDSMILTAVNIAQEIRDRWWVPKSIFDENIDPYESGKVILKEIRERGES